MHLAVCSAFPLHMGGRSRVSGFVKTLQRFVLRLFSRTLGGPSPSEIFFCILASSTVSACAPCGLSMSSMPINARRSAARVRQHRPHPHHGCAAGTPDLSAHSHRVIDHRKLENLGDVALVVGSVVHHVVEQNAPAELGCQQARDDVQHVDFPQPPTRPKAH